jgi:GNAT superfamily N-acetyltransferase
VPIFGQRTAYLPESTTGEKEGSVGGLAIMRVDQLSDEDVVALSRILIGVVNAGASVGFVPPLGQDDATSYWQGVLKPGCVLLLARRNGTIVGTGQLELAMRANGRTRAEVCRVLVDVDAQGQGIGKALMAALEVEARKEGRSLLHLDTNADDKSNRLYLAMGYIAAGTIPNWAIDADGVSRATTFYYKVLD